MILEQIPIITTPLKQFTKISFSQSIVCSTQGSLYQSQAFLITSI
jgi:hypothetical protein